jgi:hypothetical protein
MNNGVTGTESWSNVCRGIMKTAWLGIVALLALTVSVQAQGKPSALPDGISGMYTFLQEGEFVQIDLEDQTRVTGFVSRLGESDSDKGAVLDHLISNGELKGNQIHFKTKALHGTWYEFFGTVGQDNSKTPAQDGFRTMKGKLIQYTEGDSEKPKVKSREITMKSFPMDDVVRK